MAKAVRGGGLRVHRTQFPADGGSPPSPPPPAVRTRMLWRAPAEASTWALADFDTNAARAGDKGQVPARRQVGREGGGGRARDRDPGRIRHRAQCAPAVRPAECAMASAGDRKALAACTRVAAKLRRLFRPSSGLVRRHPPLPRALPGRAPARRPGTARRGEFSSAASGRSRRGMPARGSRVRRPDARRELVGQHDAGRAAARRRRVQAD